jgi:predicted transport protein
VKPTEQEEVMSSVDEATQTQIRNIEAQTGKSLDEMIQGALATGLTKHKEIQGYFEQTYGLTYGNANVMAIFTRDRQKGASGEAENFVDAQYAGAKASLRPLYDTLIAAVEGFGDDVEVSPKRTYVSLRRKKQFGLIQPAAGRVDVGVNLKGVDPAGRLEASGSFSAMCTHRVRVTSAAEIDADLLGWLRQAYEGA